jgi:hypothetical protein
MKFVIYVFYAALFCNISFVQRDFNFEKLLKTKWKLIEIQGDSLMGNKMINCSYYLSFKKVKFNKKEKKYRGDIYFNRIDCSVKLNPIYSFVSKFEINLNDSAFFVKKIDHFSYNNTLKNDRVFEKFIYFFIGSPQNIKEHKDTLFLTNENKRTIKLVELK